MMAVARVGAEAGGGRRRKNTSGKSEQLWAKVPSGNTMGYQHPSHAGQLVLTSKAEPRQCILCFGVELKNPNYRCKLSTVRLLRSQPKSRENRRETPPPQTLFEAGRRAARAHFHYRKPLHPRRRDARANVQGLMQKH